MEWGDSWQTLFTLSRPRGPVLPEHVSACAVRSYKHGVCVSSEVRRSSRAFSGNVVMLSFSAQEATACAFRSRAQKTNLVTRGLGYCALERGGVQVSVLLRANIANNTCFQSSAPVVTRVL